MTDPRNVAHDKKVLEEKEDRGEDTAAGLESAPQPGKKTAEAHEGESETATGHTRHSSAS